MKLFENQNSINYLQDRALGKLFSKTGDEEIENDTWPKGLMRFEIIKKNQNSSNYFQSEVQETYFQKTEGNERR